MGYRLSRLSLLQTPLPVNITLSLTNRCNSKCKTCNIWKCPQVEEPTLDELEMILRSLGTVPFWFTLTGGEPFLRGDLADIVGLICTISRPAIIAIPSNASLPGAIERTARKMLGICKKNGVHLVINLSLDNIAGKHDRLRGHPGSFDRFNDTFRRLAGLRSDYKNFTLGINTVISRYNADDFFSIYRYVNHISPDSYIVEPAQERKEYMNLGDNPLPDMQKYAGIIGFLRKNPQHRRNNVHGMNNIYSLLVNVLRRRYYIATLPQPGKKQAVPCYAGRASMYISGRADVCPCSVLCESLGNLKRRKYDFKGIWRGEKADRLRNAIKQRKCACTQANVSYTNLMCGWPVWQV
ncbi:MAG: radical SAM protein [archaeon]